MKTVITNDTFQYMQRSGMKNEVQSLIDSKPLVKQTETGSQYLILKEDEDTQIN